MKLIPILYSTMMVQAKQAGRKTMTRRTRGLDEINRHPDKWIFLGMFIFADGNNYAKFQWGDVVINIRCPYGKPGDILWTREKFGIIEGIIPTCYKHYAGRENYSWGLYGPPKWKPSIHMPYAACRMWDKVISIRVDRLQDISRGDAMAEGCPFPNMANGHDPRKWFSSLWEQINGADSWAANPWVWVVEFEPAEKPA